MCNRIVTEIHSSSGVSRHIHIGSLLCGTHQKHLTSHPQTTAAGSFMWRRRGSTLRPDILWRTLVSPVCVPVLTLLFRAHSSWPQLRLKRRWVSIHVLPLISLQHDRPVQRSHRCRCHLHLCFYLPSALGTGGHSTHVLERGGANSHSRYFTLTCKTTLVRGGGRRSMTPIELIWRPRNQKLLEFNTQLRVWHWSEWLWSETGTKDPIFLLHIPDQSTKHMQTSCGCHTFDISQD